MQGRNKKETKEAEARERAGRHRFSSQPNKPVGIRPDFLQVELALELSGFAHE